MIVPGVEVAPRGAGGLTPGAPITQVAAQPILAYLVPRWLAAGTHLSWLSNLPRLAALPLLLTRLSWLSRSSPALWLAGLSLQTSLAAQRILPSQRLDLIAETLYMVKGSRLPAVLRLARHGLTGSQPLLCLVHLLPQLVEALADAFFRSIRIGVDSTAEPISSSLHPICQVGLVHASQRVTQFFGCLGLRRSQLTGRIAQILFQLRKIVGELLAILRQLIALLQPGGIASLTGCGWLS